MFASIFVHALSLTDTYARPGGSISAFCEPVTFTSMCQSSVRHSITPRPLIVSTISTAGVVATILPNACDVVADAGGGLAESGEDGPGVGMLGERFLQLRRRHRLAVGHVDVH